MKKMYNLLTMLVLFLMGSTSMMAQEDNRYQVAGGSTGAGGEWTIDDVEQGVDFVLQSGKAQIAGEIDFVRGLGKSTFLNDENLFQLEVAGVDDDGETTYYLKQKSTGKYLQNDSYSYGDSKGRAWKFRIVQPSVYTAEDLNKVGEECPVTNWTVATSAAVGEANHMIFTDAKFTNSAAEDTAAVKKGAVRFLVNGGTGAAPSLGNNFDQNTWMLFPVTKMEGADYLFDALNELFPNGNADIYNPGTEPGQISQDLYDELINSYNDATKLVEEGADHAACVAAYQRCKKALEAARAGAVPIKEGYYFFKSSRNEHNGTYDDGTGLHWSYGKQWYAPQERPEGEQTMSLDDAQYVWHIQANKEANDGSFYIQNFYTKRYIGMAANATGAYVKSTDTPEEPYFIYPQDKEDFVIESAKLKKDPMPGYGGQGAPQCSALHCPSDHNNVVIWTTDAPASGWVFLNANAEDIKRLEGLIAQDKLNKALAAELTTAETTYKKGFYYEFVGGSRDGKLDNEEDGTPAGLLKTQDQLSFNMTEASEGSEEALIDGNLSAGNFYHSDWKGAYDHTLAYPYIQVDLKQQMDTIAVKMWARYEGGNDYRTGNAPGNIIVSATNTPADSASWKVIGNVQPTYPWGRYLKDMNGEDSITANKNVGFFEVALGGKYQHVRFEVTRRQSNAADADFKKMGNGAGNFNLGEMRVFQSKYNPAKSLIEAVPAAQKEALVKVIADAKAAIEAGNATQELIDKVKKAVEDFKAVYPDPQVVKDILAEAKAQYEAAEEGEAVGYFQAGAKEALKKVIDEVEPTIKEVMTLTEVNAAKELLNHGLEAFAAKLNIPAADKFYYIVSATASEQAGSAKDGKMTVTGNGSRVKWYKDSDDYISNNSITIAGNAKYVWKMIKKGNGVVFQNVATGEYMNNTHKNNVGVNMSTEADTCAFTFRSAKKPGLLNIVCKENVFLNAQPASNNLVTWGEANRADNSAFTFEEVTDELNNEIDWLVNTNKKTILTLPVSVTADDQCYSVIGRNGNNLELKSIDGTTIEAGTPFIYIDAYESEAVRFQLAEATDYEALLASVAKEAKAVNGLQGTLAAVDSIAPNNGILYNGESIVLSKLGEGAANNSGYLTSALPTTSETGDAQILIDGEITIIGGVVAQPEAQAVVNVYNLSGVKVRANVKSVNDLKGLPAGIYIMGNKKVLVK